MVSSNLGPQSPLHNCLLLCCLQTPGHHLSPFISEIMTTLNNPQQLCNGTNLVIKATLKFIGARKSKRAYYRYNIFPCSFCSFVVHSICRRGPPHIIPTKQSNSRDNHLIFNCVYMQKNVRTLCKQTTAWPKSRNGQGPVMNVISRR